MSPSLISWLVVIVIGIVVSWKLYNEKKKSERKI